MQMNDTATQLDQTADTGAPAKTTRKRAPRKIKGAGDSTGPAPDPAAGAGDDDGKDTFTGDLLADVDPLPAGQASPAAGPAPDPAAPGTELVAALGADVAALAMPTMKLEQYVTTLFSPYRSKFDKLRAEADLIAFTEEGKAHAEALQADLPEEQRRPVQLVDITSKEGFALAIRYRAAFRDDVRLAAEKMHKEKKAPVLQFGRMLDSTWNGIRDDAKPHEERFDAVIKAEEARKEQEKREAEERERERVAAIKAKIQAITDKPRNLAGATAGELEQALQELALVAVTEEEYQEFHPEALLALDAVGSALLALYEATKEREEAAAEAARLQEVERKRLADATAALEAERAELEQQKQAQAQLLEQQQLQAAQQQHATAEVQALQAVAMRDGEAIELQRLLEQVQRKIITPEAFGAMAPLADMAKGMAITSLQAKISARVAEELPAAHAEALEDHAVWLDAQRPVPAADPAPAAAPRTISVDRIAPAAAPAPAPAPAPVESAEVVAFRAAVRALATTHSMEAIAALLADELEAIGAGA